MISEDKRIHTRAELKEWLALEHKRYPMTPRHLLSYLFLWSEGAVLRRHTTLLRKTEYYINTGRRLLAMIYRVRLLRLQTRYSMHVPPNTCGKGLCINHVYPMGINIKASIGENCRIMPLVMLMGDDVKDYAATVGDNVTLGLGCKLVGGVTLADGITVGAGAVVTKSFLEPGITIAGVPARKIGGPAPQKGAE